MHTILCRILTVYAKTRIEWVSPKHLEEIFYNIPGIVMRRVTDRLLLSFGSIATTHNHYQL